MNIIADLHIHGKYSRGCSIDLNIASLEKYAKIKGLNLLGTGDFTHPKWLKEIENGLTEENGILTTEKGFPFLLQTEISLIYTQDNKGRRVHNIVLAPSLEVVKQINEELSKKGRLDYDGRPIFNIPCPEFVEMLRQISEDTEVIPAHCLLGEEQIHIDYSFKRIEDVKEGELVYTHNNRWKKVTKKFVRSYSGKIYKIRPWYFTEGLKTTSEHPFFVTRGYKCSWIKGLCKSSCSKIQTCKDLRFEDYTSEWIPASSLKPGDFIIYPRFGNSDNNKKKIDKYSITPHLCRLIGYYLAEGHLIRDEGVSLSFGKEEDTYIEDVKSIIKEIFNKHEFKIDRRKGNDIIVYSKELNNFFGNFYNSKIKKAHTKVLPNFMLELPLDLQAEVLRGWYRGDSGYTVSRELMNQMKVICLRLGIIPSIRIDTVEKYEKRGKHFINNRKITARHDLYSLARLSFFEDKFNLLNEKEFKKFKTKMWRKHGWIDKNYVYIPIRKIEVEEYSGKVYNLEVEEDNSYTSEFCCVHNCWTPWFSIFGSNSGFNSVEEAFQDQAKHIHALETGLSSDPLMNWRLSKLDKYNLVSFSDSHSYWPWRIGREATIFDIKELIYKNVLKAIRTGEGLTGTVDVDPNFGKYHLTGHRACGICLEPKESIKLNNICPKCKSKLTVGVLQRVEELADRPNGFKPKNAKEFKILIPLSEVLAQVMKKGVATQAVWKEYNTLVNNFGSEFEVLLNVPTEDLKKFTNETITGAIIKNRENNIKIEPGYDGVYGKLKFNENKKIKQKSLSDF